MFFDCKRHRGAKFGQIEQCQLLSLPPPPSPLFFFCTGGNDTCKWFSSLKFIVLASLTLKDWLSWKQLGQKFFAELCHTCVQSNHCMSRVAVYRRCRLCCVCSKIRIISTSITCYIRLWILVHIIFFIVAPCILIIFKVFYLPTDALYVSLIKH